MKSIYAILFYSFFVRSPATCAFNNTMSANTHLFNASSFTVMGPTVFPKPSDAAGEESFPLLKSTFGKHRPKVDAVFTFACEYKFNTFITFVTSLRKTGFGGDIVIAISQLDLKEKGVMEFLKNQPGKDWPRILSCPYKQGKTSLPSSVTHSTLVSSIIFIHTNRRRNIRY